MASVQVNENIDTMTDTPFPSILGEATAHCDAEAQNPPSVAAGEMCDVVNAEHQHSSTQSLLLPIHSLSNEILHEIFIYLVPSPTTCNEMLVGVDSLDPHSAPWTLTRVCRQWRELVVSSPLLWTYLQFAVDRSGRSRDYQHCAERMRIYLERSKNLSLSIYLVDVEGHAADQPVIPVLRRALPRCTYLIIQVSTVFLQALCGTTFSRLSRLDVVDAFANNRAEHVDTFTAVSAPELRTVVSSDRHWDSLEVVAIPWSQLTQVASLPVFKNISLVWLREISQVTLLQAVISHTSWIPSDTVISFPKLRHLKLVKVRGAKSGSLKKFMSALVLDNLTCLLLEYPGSKRLVFPILNGGLVDRLTVLSIKCRTDGHSENAQKLLDFITHCSQLIALHLGDIQLEASFVTGLRYLPTSSTLRRLRFLDITGCPNPPEGLSALIDMLESRCLNVPEHVCFAQQEGCLHALRVPHWLYFEKDSRWNAIRIRRNVEVVWG